MQASRSLKSDRFKFSPALCKGFASFLLLILITTNAFAGEYQARKDIEKTAEALTSTLQGILQNYYTRVLAYETGAVLKQTQNIRKKFKKGYLAFYKRYRKNANTTSSSGSKNER